MFPKLPKAIKAILPLLLQVDGGLSVETLVLPLHVGEACKVVGVNEGEIHLRKNVKRQSKIQQMKRFNFI